MDTFGTHWQAFDPRKRLLIVLAEVPVAVSMMAEFVEGSVLSVLVLAVEKVSPRTKVSVGCSRSRGSNSHGLRWLWLRRLRRQRLHILSCFYVHPL